jgi:hypothetical protein
MKTFPEFCKEAYDASFMSGAQVRQSGEGGRVGRERKKTPAEMRRMSQETDAQGNRKPIQVKDRKDIGTQKQADTRVQQPEQERGSAAVRERAAAAAKEERRKLAKERAAAKSGGEKPKAKPKDLTAQATKILSKTKPAEVDKRPADQPKRPVVGMTRQERSRITRKGQEKLEKLVRQSEAEKQGIKPEDVKLTGGEEGKAETRKTGKPYSYRSW